MVDLGWLINPILENWVVILITSLVTLFAAVISNYGIKKRFKSAKEKERQRALEKLRTIIEDQIIANRKKLVEEKSDIEELGLSSNRIEDLIEATERDHQVSLSDSTTPVSLLQDVDLRIKDSRHLDSDQINQYSSAIGKIINEIRTQQEPHAHLPEQSTEVLDQIEEQAEYDGHEKDVKELRRSAVIEEPGSKPPEGFEEMRRLGVTLIAAITALSSTMLLLNIGPEKPNTPSGPSPIVLLATLILVAIATFLIKYSSDLRDILDESAQSLDEK